MSQVYGKAESDKRYKVVVKHYLKGVLHMAYFDDHDKAHAWLEGRWAESAKRSEAKDAVDRADFQSSCGGAIFDKHESGKRVYLLGAPYLFEKDQDGS